MADEDIVFNLADMLNFGDAIDETEFIQRLNARGVRPEDYEDMIDNVLEFDDAVEMDLDNIEADLNQAFVEGNQERILELQNEQADILNAQRAIDRVGNFLNTIVQSGYYLTTPPQSRRPTEGGAGSREPLTPPQQALPAPIEPPPLTTYDIRNQRYGRAMLKYMEDTLFPKP